VPQYDCSVMRSVVPPVWVLVLVSLTLWGGEFVRRGLWEPDEARYAYVAREMRAGHHWFVPHINGKPYPDKPPLFFWLINASSVLTGGHINGVSARLPSLLGSVLTLWALTRLLSRWQSNEAAWRATLILLTTFLFWQAGSWGRIDALLCGLVMMSVYFFFVSLEDRPGRRECLAYLFAGLAVLAKGPIGLVVPMGIFGVGSAVSGDSSKLKRSHWVWGPLFAISISAVWLFAAWRQKAPADYFTALLGEKSFGRIVQSQGHSHPFYYFLWHFPLELFPWTTFVPAALTALSNKVLKRRLLGWIVFVVALFSLFVTKRNMYILPAYPAVAMLIGAAWNDISKLSHRWRIITAGAGTVLMWFLAVATIMALLAWKISLNRFAVIPSALVLLIGSVFMTQLTRREPLSSRWLVAFCGVYFFFQATVGAVVLPTLNRVKGPVEAAEVARALSATEQPVYLYGQQLAIFPLYAERQGRELWSLEELNHVISEKSGSLIVIRAQQWRDLPVEMKKSLRIVQEFRMGNKSLVLVQTNN